jgi:hypothetical protein
MDSTMIRIIISTLNDVEVRGRENLDKLLGCINALESVAQSLDAENSKASENDMEVHNG